MDPIFGKEEQAFRSGEISIIINPGTGKIVDSENNKTNARENMRIFLDSFSQKDSCFKRNTKKDYGDGRFAFDAYIRGKKILVHMPGLPIEKVRYLDLPDQNIFDFPRLYINGNSWVWIFAIDEVKEIIYGEEE